MIRKHLVAMGAACAVFASVAAAHAARPNRLTCEVLAATNQAVNVFLDDQGIQFTNLGDLFSSAIVDEQVFAQLRSLLAAFSDGQILVDTPAEAIRINAQCGQIPALIEDIED